MGKTPVRQQLAIIEALVEARTSAGLSQRELSTKLRESASFMQRIESGTRNVSVTEFIRIAHILDIDPCDLLKRAL